MLGLLFSVLGLLFFMLQDISDLFYYFAPLFIALDDCNIWIFLLYVLKDDCNNFTFDGFNTFHALLLI